MDSKSSLSCTSQLTGILSSWMTKNALDEVDTYSGLSNSLLLLINRIADLETPSSKADFGELCHEVSILRTALESLNQRIPQDLDPITSSQVSISAEVYRLASLLFLHQKISLTCGRVPFRTNALQAPFSDSEIYDLVCHVLEDLENNPNLTERASIPLWPLFIAGCSADDEFLRIKVLKIFRRTETLQRFGNITSARRGVESLWRQRDLSTDERPARIPKYKKVRISRSALDEGWEKKRCVWDYVENIMGRAKPSLT
ncbi:hypothetical protein V490_02686 [Pseudogymnoascus sp. VKM F-3557]|nr:hypothetical protein V490_02686 [Pseudogymnoascus sp. VKM F-3557]